MFTNWQTSNDWVIGAVLCDAAGNFCGRHAQWHPHGLDALTMEALAIRDRMALAREGCSDNTLKPIAMILWSFVKLLLVVWYSSSCCILCSKSLCIYLCSEVPCFYHALVILCLKLANKICLILFERVIHLSSVQYKCVFLKLRPVNFKLMHYWSDIL